MPNSNMIKYATEVGLENMSKNDLKELMIQIDLLKCENINNIEKLSYCVEIEAKLKAITEAINEVLTEETLDEWGLRMDRDEIGQLEYELRFFSRLYGKYSSSGDIDSADRVRGIMDEIEKDLNKKAVKIIITSTANRME